MTPRLPEPPGAVLVADGVSKTFRGRRVLVSASLRAMPGQIRALFGCNGCGKSTLLKIAVGWTAPDSGTVFLDGVPLARARLSTLARRGVCYLPDEGLLAPTLTVGRQLEFFGSRFPGADLGAVVDEMRVGGLVARRVSGLSGGERRRIDVAAALIRRPRCLVADEPYRGVAPLDAELLSAAFRRLATAGCAVVLTGHDAPTLLDVAQHVTWHVGGTTRELGAPAQALADDGFRRDYLGIAWSWRASPEARSD